MVEFLTSPIWLRSLFVAFALALASSGFIEARTKQVTKTAAVFALLAGIHLTDAFATGEPTSTWLRVLCSYTGILFLGGLVTFEFAVEK